jgi:hypothetical protein
MSHWYVRTQITRWVDDHFPGIVECRFADRFGREWLFIEKLPVVGGDLSLNADSAYPQPAFIGCEVISRRYDDTGREVAEIDTDQPWGIESEDGVTRFQVFADQLTKAP